MQTVLLNLMTINVYIFLTTIQILLFQDFIDPLLHTHGLLPPPYGH